MTDTALPPSGDLAFGVDARHIRQLGQELVGDRTTALTELIKNAYDADATWVQLRFADGALDEGGVLEVEDDGSGMTLEDLRGGWMRISTAGKERESVSPLYRRTRAGRKGIGRFATETLGRRLILRTTTPDQPWALVVEFDWEHGYPEGVDLSEVTNPYRIERAPASEHGTTLRIEGLYDAWDQRRRDRVRKAVRLLQPPFPVAQVLVPHAAREAPPDPGFQVEVFVGDRPDAADDDPYEEFVAAATARVRADIDADGRVKVAVGSDVLDIDAQDVLGNLYPRVGRFSIDAAYFIYNKDAIGGISLAVAREMRQVYSGMRLYRDGLRVMPYGEPGNDWLKLDQLQGARSGALVPVANANWFGQILISRVTNPELRDTASREGLVDNEGYSHLREATRQALLWGAVEVGRARQRKITTRDPTPSSTRRQILAEAQGEVERAIGDELPTNLAARVTQIVSAALGATGQAAEASDAAESRRIEALLTEIELLSILASLGTSIAVFSHEVRSTLTTLTAALEVLDRASARLDEEARAQLDIAREGMEELQDLVGYIDAYVSASQRRTREPQALHTVLDQFVSRLSQNLARGVDFAWEVQPASLRTAPMARSELEAVLINFLTNAIKAMDAEGHPQRRIRVTARPSGKEILLRFEDTGTGVDPAIRDKVFDPFVSDTRSSLSELGSGTGLGLKIVADIASANGGTVALAEPSDGYTTSFELRLPRWREQLEVR
ncbi:MAG: ATP-binding protein [Actinomycetota bacterium]|nr:ATP-binding protein [Actinomycetota bacterium]